MDDILRKDTRDLICSFLTKNNVGEILLFAFTSKSIYKAMSLWMRDIRTLTITGSSSPFSFEVITDENYTRNISRCLKFIFEYSRNLVMIYCDRYALRHMNLKLKDVHGEDDVIKIVEKINPFQMRECFVCQNLYEKAPDKSDDSKVNDYNYDLDSYLDSYLEPNNSHRYTYKHEVYWNNPFSDSDSDIDADENVENENSNINTNIDIISDQNTINSKRIKLSGAQDGGSKMQIKKSKINIDRDMEMYRNIAARTHWLPIITKNYRTFQCILPIIDNYRYHTCDKQFRISIPKVLLMTMRKLCSKFCEVSETSLEEKIIIDQWTTWSQSDKFILTNTPSTINYNSPDLLIVDKWKSLEKDDFYYEVKDFLSTDAYRHIGGISSIERGTLVFSDYYSKIWNLPTTLNITSYLREYSINQNTETEFQLSQHRNLEKLELRHRNQDFTKKLCFDLSSLPRLHSLKLYISNFHSDANGNPITKITKKIKDFDPLETKNETIFNLSTLKFLHLVDGNIRNKTIKFHTPQLSTLIFKGSAYEILDSQLDTNCLKDSFARLETLEIFCAKPQILVQRLKIVGLDNLDKLKHLKFCDISENISSIKYFLDMTPNLTHLTIILSTGALDETYPSDEEEKKDKEEKLKKLHIYVKNILYTIQDCKIILSSKLESLEIIDNSYSDLTLQQEQRFTKTTEPAILTLKPKSLKFPFLTNLILPEQLDDEIIQAFNCPNLQTLNYTNTFNAFQVI